VSITTGCLSSGSSEAASGRATTSAAPPGGNGLMNVTGRAGYASCAHDAFAASAAAAVPAMKRLLSMSSSFCCGFRLSAFDAQDLLQRMHHLHEVGLVRHDLVDVLVGARDLVDHALVLAADDAFGLAF